MNILYFCDEQIILAARGSNSQFSWIHKTMCGNIPDWSPYILLTFLKYYNKNVQHSQMQTTVTDYFPVTGVCFFAAVPSKHEQTNADLKLGQRRRRWTNNKSALVQRLVIAGQQTSLLAMLSRIK